MPNYFISQAKLVEGETVTWSVMPNYFISQAKLIAYGRGNPVMEGESL